MKIALSTDDGHVSAHFGRCPSYTLVDIQDGRVIAREEIPNPGHSPGFLPNFLSQRGVQTIIAGGMGPRAQGLFAEKNIQTIIGVQGAIDEVIERFLRQDLEPGQDLCDHGHGDKEPCRHEHSPGEPEKGAHVGGTICVTAKGKDLDAELDPNFGRARYFLLVNPKTLEYEAFENPSSEAAHGAGIQSAQFVAGHAASTVLTGQVGPNARQVLESAGIRVINVEKCTVRQALSWLQRR
jgi:predicted Fe-Mo cluster-binding NifX family protein